MRYNFDWDPAKAESNVAKHGVAFERAATLFRDPNALSVVDDEHSELDERWLTLGIEHASGRAPHVTEVDKENCPVRIISARKATKTEATQYETREV